MYVMCGPLLATAAARDPMVRQPETVDDLEDLTGEEEELPEPPEEREGRRGGEGPKVEVTPEMKEVLLFLWTCKCLYFSVHCSWLKSMYLYTYLSIVNPTCTCVCDLCWSCIRHPSFLPISMYIHSCIYTLLYTCVHQLPVTCAFVD